MRKARTFILSIYCLSASAFSPQVIQTVRPSSDGTLSTTRLSAGGFGAAGAGMGKKGAKSDKQVKLKPKQQWDRYLDLKKDDKVAVGVRMKDDESGEWIQVGSVRTKGNEHTAIAVALQRALIADHAKRLFPLQISPKKTLEWGYLSGEQWTVVDKSILEEQELPDGVEKIIGFEGTPDPATGFYCVYDGGKLKLGEESSFK